MRRTWILVALLCACAPPRAARVERVERLPPLTDPGLVLGQDERNLWREAAELDERARRSGAVRADPALERYLLGVVRRLTPPAALQRLEVRVRVLASPALTAFVTPDGGTFVSMGLLARLENEAQLAMVLGRELVHAVNRHAMVERRTLGSGAARSAALPFALGPLGTKAAVSGYARDLEREADEEALSLVAHGGWDLREAPRPFELLAAWVREEKLDEPFLLASHARLSERLESVRQLVAAMPDDGGVEVGAQRYRSAVRGVVRDLEGGER